MQQKSRRKFEFRRLKNFHEKLKVALIKRLETKKLGRSRENLPIPAMGGVGSGWRVECRKVPHTEILLSNYQLSSSSSF